MTYKMLVMMLTSLESFLKKIDINPKNSQVLRNKIELQEDDGVPLEGKKRSLNISDFQNAQIFITTTKEVWLYPKSISSLRSRQRVNKYLKDNFGCNKIYYQGATKVASVLAFGILSICIHQSLKMIT